MQHMILVIFAGIKFCFFGVTYYKVDSLIFANHGGTQNLIPAKITL